MPNNLLRIQGFNTDDAGISFYKPDGTVYRLSFISDGSLRYGKFINGAWTEVGNVLTNADIEPSQQSVTKTLLSGTSNITIATYVANKVENIMISVYAGFAQNYTGVRTLCIYKGGTPIVADKGPATDGEGLHQSSVCANIHLNAGESINIAAQQNSGTSLSVNFVINATCKVTFK